MSNWRAVYPNTVDERPVMTVVVADFINALGYLADGAVLSRDRRVADHHLVCSVSPQAQRIFRHSPDRSFQRPGDRHQPRIQQISLQRNSLVEFALLRGAESTGAKSKRM